MSKIIDVIEKAKKMRETSDQASKGLIITKRAIVWITLLYLMGVFILVIILNGCNTKDSKKDLISINYRLEQIEKKLDQLLDQQNAIRETIKMAKQEFPQRSSATTSITKTPTAEIKTSPFAPPKEMPQHAERYHEVKRGETLYSISQRYGISVDEIRRLNNLKANQNIQTGQKILISKGNKR